MYSKNRRKSKLKSNTHRKLLISSVITVGILSTSNVLSGPIINPKFNEINEFSNKSFITKAVEKTGPSVVTIETQRFIKKRKLTRNSQIFLDPYFERFFRVRFTTRK